MGVGGDGDGGCGDCVPRQEDSWQHVAVQLSSGRRPQMCIVYWSATLGGNVGSLELLPIRQVRLEVWDTEVVVECRCGVGDALWGTWICWFLHTSCRDRCLNGGSVRIHARKWSLYGPNFRDTARIPNLWYLGLDLATL